MLLKAPLPLKCHGEATLPYSERIVKQWCISHGDEFAQKGSSNPSIDEPILYRQQCISNDDKSSQPGPPNSLLDDLSVNDDFVLPGSLNYSSVDEPLLPYTYNKKGSQAAVHL